MCILLISNVIRKTSEIVVFGVQVVSSPDALFQSTVESRYLEVDGTIFYNFKLPEVQINLHFG